MNDTTALLKQARDLFQQGQPGRAEEVVDQLLREDPRDPTAQGFRAYLLYTRGDLDEAIVAYRRLVVLEPRVPGHYANLGLICFKKRLYQEAQRAFERQLELQPGDPRALRSLGSCHERQLALEKALDCFTRCGDEERAAVIRERLAHPEEVPPPRGPDSASAATGGGGAVQLRTGKAPAASEPDVKAWLKGASLRLHGAGRDFVRAGPGEVVVKVREKVFLNPAFCVGHRGVVVFAPASREAEKAAAKYGERHGVLARTEGNGELVLSGLGRGLLTLHLGGERLFVNWGSLVLCGTGIAVSFDLVGLRKESFLAAALDGAGQLVLAVRGAPVVLPVASDYPTLARPEAVVAWTEGLGFEAEVVPELKKLVGKTEALRYRFHGTGHLVLQSC